MPPTPQRPIVVPRRPPEAMPPYDPDSPGKYQVDPSTAPPQGPSQEPPPEEPAS